MSVIMFVKNICLGIDINIFRMSYLRENGGLYKAIQNLNYAAQFTK